MATEAPRTARRRAGAGGRPRPRRLLDRRPRAAGDLPRTRHQRRRRHLGPDLLQPGDGAGRGAGGAAGAPGRPRPRGRRRPRDLRRRRARLRARRQPLDPDPRPLRPGPRRRRSRSPRRSSCCRRRSAPSAAATVVWASAGATGAALGPAVGGMLTELVSWQSIFLIQVPIALAAAVPILAVARHEMATRVIERELRRDRPAAPLGQRRPGDGLGGDRGGALPARPAADRRLAPEPDRRRDRRLGDAAGGARSAAALGPLGRSAPGPAPRPARSSSPAASPAWRCCRRPRWR